MYWAKLKIELIKQDKWYGHSFIIRILGVHFGNYVLDNSNWDKTNDSLTKESIFGTDCNSL